MKTSITQVPQADELAKVILTVEAVANDRRSDQQIADYVGFTDRQGRYYRTAGEILGLLENLNNNATLTPKGEELIVLDDNNRLRKIRSILKENLLFGDILNFIEKNQLGVARQEILDHLFTSIDGAESTITRRLSTIISWLTYSQLVKLDIRESGEKETVYKINDLLEDSDFVGDLDFHDSIYPANYSNEELDIKETHMQVVSLVRKKEQEKIIVPEFQRNQVWKQQQKSRFIESLILNIPVPPFYLSQDLYGNMVIIDGLQRSSAIFEFLEDSYKLVGLEALPHLNDKLYTDLDKDLRARIEDREILLFILKASVPMSVVYDIFNRINSNGTPLTRQEIRNCIFIGQSTRLLAKLADEPSFKNSVDYGLPSLRMKDREAILRFFSFIVFDYEKDYKGDLDDFLGRTMRKINRYEPSQLLNLQLRFLRVIDKTFDFFEWNNFRLPTENGRGRVNLALFEVITTYFDKNSDDFLETNRDAIIINYYNILLKDPSFIDSVKSSTSSEKNVKTRFRMTFKILSNV